MRPSFRADIQDEARAVFELRELLRGHKHRTMPEGRDGFVVEDLDLILRWYGPRFNQDSIGRFRLVELKRLGAGILEEAQRRTFDLLDSVITNSDRYDGFYVVEFDDDRHREDTRYYIGAHVLSSDEFLDWCLTPESPFPPWGEPKSKGANATW